MECSLCSKEDDIVIHNSLRYCRHCYNSWKQNLGKKGHRCPTCPGITGNKYHPCKKCDPIPYMFQAVSSLTSEAARFYYENKEKSFSLGEKAFEKLDDLLFKLEEKLSKEEEEKE